LEKSELQRRICAGLPDAVVQVDGDDGAHYQATVICDAFEGRRTLERHRMVYGALGAAVGTEIHALSLRTLTRSEAGESGGNT